MSRRILGIDPGSRITGFGVIDVLGHDTALCGLGLYPYPTGATLAERIKVLIEHLFAVVDTYQPHESAVEQVFVNVNPASTLMLGQARGAIERAVLRQLPIAEYTALQVKQSVVGQGKAPKEQVQAMVVRMLSLSGTPQADGVGRAGGGADARQP